MLQFTRMEIALGNSFCIEIQAANTPTISKGFYQCVEDLKPVCPLGLFLEKELGLSRSEHAQR